MRNIAGNAFRSGAVLLCAALVAGLALSATLVVRGAEDQLENTLERLGADIIVIPWGTMRTEDMQGARLLSMAIEEWMPRSYIYQLGAVEGVDRMTPQLYLTTVKFPAYSTRPEVYVVAYEPETDFAIKPWLENQTVRPGLNEAIGGSMIYAPNMEGVITVAGHDLELVGHLKPTGGDLDQTLLVSFETAKAIIQTSRTQDQEPLYTAPDSVSAVLVQVRTEADPHDVAVRILEETRSLLPIESTGLFQTQRAQMIGLLRSAFFILSVIWMLSIISVGLIFSMAVNERRREIAVLRALGARQRFILGSLLAESAVLALAGGTIGSALTIIAVSSGGTRLFETLGLPISIPSLLALTGLALAGLVLALVSVVLAASVPAVRISRAEVALAMRE